MKSKNFVTIFFVTVGILGIILLIFGSQSNGTLSDDIKTGGLSCLGIFAIWAIVSIVDAYTAKKELENM